MDTQINTALIQSISPLIQDRLMDEKYRLEPKKCTYLINNKSMVICILNGEVGEHQATFCNIKLAQEFYKGLPSNLRQLAELKAEVTNNVQPIVIPTACTTRRAIESPVQASSESKKEPSYSVSITETSLTEEHCKYLKTLLENKIDGVHFNDRLKVITSLDEQLYYAPNSDGEFSIQLTGAALPNYEAIKNHYLNWVKKTPTCSKMSPATRPIQSHNSSLGRAAESPHEHARTATSLSNARHDRMRMHQPSAFVQPAAIEVERDIRRLLDNIDSEIDQINMPDKYDRQRQQLGDVLKSKFSLYKDQLNNKRRVNTAQVLKADFAQLKEMQRSMYFAVCSPDVKPNDLPLKGIKNRGYECLPNSENQCDIHNQYYLFFVTAYQLIGETALKLDKTAENCEGNAKIQKEYQSIKNEASSLEKKIAELKNNNVIKTKIIENFKKNPTGLENEIESRKQEIFENKLIIEGSTTQQELLKRKQEILKKETDIALENKRLNAIKKATKWSDFYKHQLSQSDKTTRKLPEPFGNNACRGNDFPTDLFGVPATLSANYNYIAKENIPTVLHQPWTAIYVDMNGDHFKTYVKRKNGSIAEINDCNVIEIRFQNVNQLITFYTETNFKNSLRHRIN